MTTPKEEQKHTGLPKGESYDGPCNVTACQKPHAIYWNTSTRAYYCHACAQGINQYASNVNLCVHPNNMPAYTRKADCHEELVPLTQDEIAKILWTQSGDMGDRKAKNIARILVRSGGIVREATHADDIAVDQFAEAMKQKLAKKRHEGRGGWEDPAQCDERFLWQLLHEHVAKGDPVDIGNLAMMLWSRSLARATNHQAGDGK